MNNIQIITTTPYDTEVIPLIEELSSNLGGRFGNDGKDSFQVWDETNPKYIFVKAVLDSEVVGCGAIRPIDNNIGEVKRMFSKYKRMGIGNAVLSYLENRARACGYTEIWLETRRNNLEACNFYLKNQYEVIENYGKYIGRSEAICFGKKI